jgi:hypothetical protein
MPRSERTNRQAKLRRGEENTTDLWLDLDLPLAGGVVRGSEIVCIICARGTDIIFSGRKVFMNGNVGVFDLRCGDAILKVRKEREFGS